MKVTNHDMHHIPTTNVLVADDVLQTLMVHPEGASAKEDRPAQLSIESDSGTRLPGLIMYLIRHQFDGTCGIVAVVFDAWVDVAGLSNDCRPTGVGWSR